MIYANQVATEMRTEQKAPQPPYYGQEPLELANRDQDGMVRQGSHSKPPHSRNGYDHQQYENYQPDYDDASVMDFSQDGMDEYRGDQNQSDYGSSQSSDSNDSTIAAKSKKRSSKLGCYTYLKILNGMLYLGTLFVAFAYFTTTKYTSKFVYYTFYGLLVTRPALIVFYSLIVILLEITRRKSKASKPWKKKKDKV